MAPPTVWWRLLAEHGGPAPEFRRRLAGILATSVLTTPLRLAERMVYGRRVARTHIRHSPVYVHGFSRSGTTHLHNLMAHDPAFGCVTTFQAVASPFFLVARGWLERLIVKRVPSKRPMDNMALSLRLPQEEEVALAAISHLSPAHLLSFPDRAEQITGRYGTMRLNPSELEEWTTQYQIVLRKATIAFGGRRLVLKSPTNLGRTALLRSMFPSARFVFIMRNPYEVFSSTERLYRTMVPTTQLRRFDWNRLEAAFLDNYVVTMRRYMRDRAAIPKNKLVEVRFEDLESDPMGVLEHTYTQLELPGWDEARGPVGEYARSLEGYRKNRYEQDQATIDKVDRHWGFAVKEWGYQP